MLDPESQRSGGPLKRYSGALIRVAPASTTYTSDTSGAVSRNRTLDILITKQALYLLSYDGVYFPAFAMFCIGVDTGYDPVASTEPGTVRANP